MKLFALIVLCGAAAIEAKVYTRCEFVHAIRGHVPASEIDDWTCIARYESNYNTKATNKNTNGSTDYGIFQINNHWWCSPGPHNACHVSCASLLESSITKSLNCAKLIHKQQGFKAWVAWQKHCAHGHSKGFAHGC